MSCLLCNDSGTVVKEEGLFRCYCAAGMAQKPMFAPSDKKQLHPIELKQIPDPNAPVVVHLTGRDFAAGVEHDVD